MSYASVGRVLIFREKATSDRNLAIVESQKFRQGWAKVWNFVMQRNRLFPIPAHNKKIWVFFCEAILSIRRNEEYIA